MSEKLPSNLHFIHANGFPPNAYNTLLRNKEKYTYDNMDAGRMSTSDLLISPMRSQKKSANVKNNNEDTPTVT